MSDSSIKRGDRVDTPHGPGTVAYVRMAAPSYATIEVVSVVLDSNRDRRGYAGTLFSPGEVTA